MLAFLNQFRRPSRVSGRLVAWLGWVLSDHSCYLELILEIPLVPKS